MNDIEKGSSVAISFNYELMLVTPEQAAAWLSASGVVNRSSRTKEVRDLVTAMREGRFRVTHQGIAIDVNGHLQDGQHRLLAIVQFGEPVWMMVATNVPVENFHVIDTGSRRTIPDLLTLRGYKNSAHLAAVASLAWHWERGHATFNKGVREDHVAKMLVRYPDLADVPKLKPIREYRLPSPMVSFLAYIGADEGFTFDLTREPSDTAAGMFLQTLEFRKMKGYETDRKVQLALFIQARNDFARGVVPTRKYQFKGTDAFPTVDWAAPIKFGGSASPDDPDDV